MQLALYDVGGSSEPGRADRPDKRARRTGEATEPGRGRSDKALCAACREREARYGFRDRKDDDPTVPRPKTLCFDCFRMEIDRRRAAAEHLARGWNATQAELPLAGKLEETTRRRRRAQIAARHALGLR